MVRAVKTYVKELLRFCGFDVRRIPQFEPYEWLKEMNIRTVLDIGANTGQFASQLHRLLPGAMIYSFEPLEECYSELLKNMEHLPQFRAFNFALGDTNGQAQIYRNDYTPSSSLLSMEDIHKRAFPIAEHATPHTIEIRRMDDIAEKLEVVEKLLVKIDVQGTEDKVIMGGQRLLSTASVLIVETCFESLYKGQLLFDGIYDLLRQRGFLYAGSEGAERNPQNGRILYCDSVFCKAEV